MNEYGELVGEDTVRFRRVLNDREPRAFWKRIGELDVEYQERIPA